MANRFLELGDYALKHLVWHLLELGDCRSVAIVLDIDYLEIKAERGWIFELIEELASVARMQPESDRRLDAISGALQRNGGYIARRPTTLFQCVWNTCCWENPDLLGAFFLDVAGARSAYAQPSSITTLLNRWRMRRAERSPGLIWVRSLRPTWTDLNHNVQIVLTLARYEGQPAIVRFSPDSAVVVIWFCEYESGHVVSGVPRAWDCASGRVVPVPREMHKGPPEEGCSPDGRLVASYGGPDGGWDFPVRVAGFGAPSDIREYHTELDTNISAVAISPTNRLLAGVGYGLEGGDAYVWDVASGEVVARPNACDHSGAVSFSADETQLAFASGSELKLRDLASGNERTIGTQDDWIRVIAFAPDGRKIASISHDGTCRIYVIGSSSSDSKPVGPSSYIAELGFSPSGDRLVSRADNGTLHLWDGGAGAPVACLATSDMVVLQGGDAHRCLFITDETVRSVASLAGVWDVRTGRKLDDGRTRRFDLACALTLSPDGSRLCSHRRFERDSKSHQIELFDPREGRLASFTHNAAIHCVAFTPDSQHFAYGTGDGRLRVRAASTGELRREFRAHDVAIAGCTVSRDGTRLATLGVDQQLMIWRWAELSYAEDPTADRPRTVQPERRWGKFLGRFRNFGLPARCRNGTMGDFCRLLSSRREILAREFLPFTPEARLDVRKGMSADGVEDQNGRSLRVAFAAFDDQHVVVQAGRLFYIWDLRTQAYMRTVRTTDLLDEVVDGQLTHLRTSGDEVVISDASSGSPKAWFPVPVGLSPLTFVRNPASDVWAGMISHSILHIRLERD
jgi:WD40 repeat protein